jgi:hypothetical protein
VLLLLSAAVSFVESSLAGMISRQTLGLILLVPSIGLQYETVPNAAQIIDTILIWEDERRLFGHL